MTILLAEDDPINQLLLKGILSPLGHDIVVVKNGLEAKQALEKTQFDLLLLDVMTPDHSGLELTRWCRSTPRHAEVPILLITALSQNDDLVQGYDSGATDYITKPFQRVQLLYRVKHHLRFRELQLALESLRRELTELRRESKVAR